jgi:subtilisin-like proprotein convertase family protein
VVYQCLTGAVPFDKETEVATLFAHLQDPLPKVSAVRPGVPDELDEVVARGMAKDREERYPTCTAMMDAFVDAVGLQVAREPVAFDPTVVAAPAQHLPDSGPLLPPAPEGAVASASTPPIEPAAPAKPATPATAGAGGPPRKGSSRLAAILAGSVLGLAAIVVAIVLLTGGDDGPGPGPGPNPSGQTGTTGTTGSTGGIVSPLELSGGSVIDIPRRGTGVPYPSTIQVSDVQGVITDVTVTLAGFSHEFPNDLDVLLVGPGGQSVLLAEGVGGAEPVEDVTVTFDDDGVPLTPGQAPSDESTFRPSSNAGDGFGFNGPAPVPPPPYGSALGVFDGTDPNGTWSLFVFDEGRADAGQIAGGWGLRLEFASDEDVIFRDDFSSPSSGWDVFDDAGFYGHYEGGSYVLGVPAFFQVGGDFNTSTQELSTLTDVRVEATGRLRGNTDALLGLACRAQSPEDYYYFLIQGDGSYYIGENHGAQFENFSSSSSPAIVPGEAPNRIAIECVDGPDGVNLRMFVNGIAIDTAVDTEEPITSGAAGFTVESRRRVNGPAEAVFDDYVVTAATGAST